MPCTSKFSMTLTTDFFKEKFRFLKQIFVFKSFNSVLFVASNQYIWVWSGGAMVLGNFWCKFDLLIWTGVVGWCDGAG